MIRWLVIALFIYLMIRLITGRGRGKKRGPTFQFRYGKFSNREPNNNRSKSDDLDQVEEAEYEDITEIDDSEKKHST
ncbi:MAG: hypothetical protein WD315_04870 [Balneolaceae bacterium]